MIMRATPEDFEDQIKFVLENADELDLSAKNEIIRQVSATYASLGNAEQAKSVLNRLEPLESSPVRSRVALIEIAANQGDEKRVSELLTEIRQIEGASGPFGNVISAQQTLRGIVTDEGVSELTEKDRVSLRAVREQLKDAREQRPSWLLVIRMLGSVEQILGNEEIALEYYREAISQGDYTKNVVQYVVSALYRAKNYEAADQILQQISKNRPTLITGDLARAAREVAFAQQNYDQASQLSEQLLDYSDDWRDYLTASRLRYAQGERGKAVEEPFLIALQKFPKVPEVLLAYVAYLERDGRADQAMEELEKAKEILPKEPATLIPLTMARGYDILNEGEEAEKAFVNALEIKPDDYKIHLELASYFVRSRQYNKAGVHLDFLSSPKSEAPEEIQAVARRWKIEAIAVGGTYEDVMEAYEQSDTRKTKDDPLTITDLRLQVRILSGLNTKKDQQELIDVLTELEDRNALSTGERLLLASLHEKLDHWEEAKRRYEKLLEDESGLTTAMITFANSLIRKDLFEDARKWINRAKESQPNALVIQLIETRLITEESSFEEAFQDLENYLKQDHVLQSPQRVVRDLLANNTGRQVLDQFRLKFDSDKQFSALIFKGMQALQQGEVLDSIRFLTPVIEDERVQDEIKAFYYRSGSQLLDEMKQYAAAETLWRKALEFADRPQDTIQLVELVARQDKVNEALEICDARVQGNYPDTLAAQNYIAVLRAGAPEQQHFQHVEAFIAKALQKNPNPRLKRFMADLKDLSGQHEQAVMLYKEVLSENDKDVIALNNLAYISALLGQDLNFSLNSIEAAINITGPIGALLDNSTSTTDIAIYLKAQDTGSEQLLEVVTFGSWDGTGYPQQTFNTRDDLMVDLPVLPGTYDVIYRRWSSGDGSSIGDHQQNDSYAFGYRTLQSGVTVSGTTTLNVELAPGRVMGNVRYAGAALPTHSTSTTDIAIYLKARDTGSEQLLEVVTFGSWDGTGYPQRSFNDRDDLVVNLARAAGNLRRDLSALVERGRVVDRGPPAERRRTPLGTACSKRGVVVSGTTSLSPDIEPSGVAGSIVYEAGPLPTHSMSTTDIAVYLRARDTGSEQLLEVVTFGSWDGTGYPQRTFNDRDDLARETCRCCRASTTWSTGAGRAETARRSAITRKRRSPTPSAIGIFASAWRFPRGLAAAAAADDFAEL